MLQHELPDTATFREAYEKYSKLFPEGKIYTTVPKESRDILPNPKRDESEAQHIWQSDDDQVLNINDCLVWYL